MSETFHPKIILIDNVDAKQFLRSCVGCIVMSQSGQIVLQLRDNDCRSFPECLATFGGGIEPNETPMQTLIRELKEELGAVVKEEDVISLGAITTSETHYNELIYVYFWQDKFNTITGCYEGKAKYYNNIDAAKCHPKIMDDVCWLLRECKNRRLL